MKKTLCLLVMIMLLFSSVSLAQRRERIRHNNYQGLAAAFEIFLDTSKPLRKYLSDLFKTDFDNIENAPDVLQSLMPTFVPYAQQRVLRQYGIDISSLFSQWHIKAKSRKGVLPDRPVLPPELAPFAPILFWGMVVISAYYLVDETGERYIVYDLEHNSNFTHDAAVAAAEHITAEGAEEAGRFLDNLEIGSLANRFGIGEGLANLANFIEALFEARDNDLGAYDPDEGFVPGGIGGRNGRRNPPPVGMGGPGGYFFGLPGPGESRSSGGQGVVTTGPCACFGPIGIDANGNPIYGWFPCPC